MFFSNETYEKEIDEIANYGIDWGKITGNEA